MPEAQVSTSESLQFREIDPKQRPLILLVEDEKPIRDVIVPWLFAGGFNCREANTGGAAIERLHSQIRIDLVLSNILLPEVDGFTLLLYVKSRLPKMRFVFLTAIQDPDARKEALKNGADGFLNKPCTGMQLINEIRSVLLKFGPQN